MQRFRLLGFYVVGVVAVVGLTVWGIAVRRTAADAGAPRASEVGTVVPSSANTEPSPQAAGASPASPTAATTGTASEAKASINNSAFDPKELVVTKVSGRTEPVPSRRGVIAPVVLHPVKEVLVSPGDRVKKGQTLVKLDADEPGALVRAKKAALNELQASLARLKAQPRKQEQAEARASLESAKVNTRAAREALQRLESLWQQGSVPDRSFHEAQSSLQRAQADEKAAAARLERLIRQPVALEIAEMEARVAAAQAAVESAVAELEHYTLSAPIDGVISWLDVNVGAAARPGTLVWGEILDLREVDVCCELTPEQLDGVSLGQAAEVSPMQSSCSLTLKSEVSRCIGRVVFVGIAGDQKTGRVPVRIRLTNPDGRLRCYVTVRVRFLDQLAAALK
jgi:multidrug resistance efflux pump